MTDPRAFEAYQISARVPKGSGEGLFEERYIAIKRSVSEAIACVREHYRSPISTDIIDSGPTVMEEARRRGIKGDGVQKL